MSYRERLAHAPAILRRTTRVAFPRSLALSRLRTPLCFWAPAVSQHGKEAVARLRGRGRPGLSQLDCPNTRHT